MNISVPDPPPSEAKPPPCPACNSTAMARTNESSSRMAIRILETMRQVSYSARGGLHKLGPALGIEGRATDEHAVELRLGEEFRDVLQAHAAAIYDPRLARAVRGQPGADLPMHQCGVLRGRVAARLGGGGRGARAGEGALRSPGVVRGARQQVFALSHGLGRRLERHRRREEPHGAVVVTPVAGSERLQVGPSLGRPEVHLPVGGKEQPPHASSSAATPGRGLPSRNSRDAPPPLETWVSFDVRPATAAAESPPPTTLVAPRRVASTIATATARVPASNGGCSNTPIGPFQTTVFARSRRARESRRVVSSMSNTAQSSLTLSLKTSLRSAARSRLGAYTAPRGRTSIL